MKKLIIGTGFFFIFCMASIVMAGENFSGIWEDQNPGTVNSVYIYSQSGNKVQVTGYFEHRGVPCVWSGTGTVNGNKVEHTVNYSKRHPDPIWRGADGKLILTLSADGKTLSGTWYNNNKESGTKTIVKRK
jgi:hypothetical protein